jgi:predicted TIM-barrel fold metal-dependent hydrolase
MKQDIELYDFHCHVMEPFALVPAASFQPPGPDNARNIVSFLKTGGVKKIAVPAISLYARSDLPCNFLALYAKLLAPGRVFALAGLRRSLSREGNAGMTDQARKLLAAGFDGIKLICKPNLRRVFQFPINDPVFNDFYEEAERQNWPILFHVGDPASFWDKDRAPSWAVENGWYYGEDRHIPSCPALYEEVFAVLKRHPRLRFVFAHFFFMSERLDEIAALFDAYPNVCFDLTPGSEMYPDFSSHWEKTRELFTAYADRFVFGTDNTGARGALWKKTVPESLNKIRFMRKFFEEEEEIDGLGFKKLRGLNLDEPVLEKIYHKNFTRILGEEPVPVNREIAAALCGEYRKAAAAMAPVEGEGDTAGLLEELQKIMAGTSVEAP